MLVVQVVVSVTIPAAARAPGRTLWEESWCWGCLRGCHCLQEGGGDGMRPLVSPVDDQAKENAPSPGIRAKESRTCTLLAVLLATFAQMWCLCCTTDRDFCMALGVAFNYWYQTCWALIKIFWKFGFRSQPVIWLHFSWTHLSLACHETEEFFQTLLSLDVAESCLLLLHGKGEELTCRWVGHLGHDRDQSQNVEGLHIFDTRGGRGTSSSRTGLLPRELQYGLTDRAVWSPDLRSQQPCWCDQERWVGVNTDHQEQGWDCAFPRGLYMTLPCGHREPECMSGGTSALSPGTPNSFCSHYRQ